MIVGGIILWITLVTGIVWVSAVIAIAIGLEQLRTHSGTSKPRVSVLIAVRNEEDNIPRCLKALSIQDYPVDLREFIVIDDNSTDRTAEIVNDFKDQIPGLMLIRAKPPTEGVAPKKNALITGINGSSGEVIITTDADCAPPPGWLNGIARLFELGVDAVVGYSPLEGKGMVGALVRFDGFINAVTSAGTIGLGIPTSAVGRNLAYRRSVWQEINGFGQDVAGASGDDDLLLQRIAEAGYKTLFNIDPDTFVPAKGQESFARWWQMKRRHFSAGKRYKPSLVVTGAVLYLFNPALILAAGMTLAGYFDPIVLAAIWGAKVSIDGLTLSRGAKLFRMRNWALTWLIAEIISPLIFTFLLPASLIGNIKWKDRSLKR